MYKRQLSTIKNLDNQLEKLPGVQSVLTILDAPIFFQPKVPLADLMDNLKTLESEDIDLVAAKEEIISNPVYSELIISPSGDTTAMQVTLKENPLYRRLITDRYELLGLNGMSNSQKKELNNINQQISQINDDEAKERADLIAQIRELLLQNSDKGTLFLGGASMIATDMMGFIKSDLTKIDILINNQKIDALSMIVHKSFSNQKAREIAANLQKLIPRQMFDVPIQVALGAKIISRETVKAFRKNVTAKLYGGDVTRKMKLLEKQKKGKKKMKQLGRVSIPQDAFLNYFNSEQ